MGVKCKRFWTQNPHPTHIKKSFLLDPLLTLAQKTHMRLKEKKKQKKAVCETTLKVALLTCKCMASTGCSINVWFISTSGFHTYVENGDPCLPHPGTEWVEGWPGLCTALSINFYGFYKNRTHILPIGAGPRGATCIYQTCICHTCPHFEYTFNFYLLDFLVKLKANVCVY